MVEKKDDRKRDDLPPDPFEEWRNRMSEDPFLGPFFADIDREFERMRDSLSRMLQGMEEGQGPEGDPFVYGFSLRMGPDGKPQFREFGNVKPNAPGTPDVDVEGAREPLVDIQEGEQTIAITVELPGVEKSDINVRAKEREIVLKVANADRRRYFKRIDLPTRVLPETTHATYKNGVLDIEVGKAEDADEGTPVEVG